MQMTNRQVTKAHKKCKPSFVYVLFEGNVPLCRSIMGPAYEYYMGDAYGLS